MSRQDRDRGRPVRVPCLCNPFAFLGVRNYTSPQGRNSPSPEQHPWDPPERLKRRVRDLSPTFRRILVRGNQVARTQPSWLFRLPAELRVEIWQQALPRWNVRLGIRGGHLRAIDFNNSRWGAAQKREILALPLTCRQAYLETISLVYGLNTFYLQMPQCGLYLDRVLIRQRIDEIRLLNLQWYVGSPPEAGSPAYLKWCKIWELIASMESLSYVHIDLETHYKWQKKWGLEEATLLEIVKSVTRPAKFELSLMWPPLVGSDPLCLPCEVSRRSFP